MPDSKDRFTVYPPEKSADSRSKVGACLGQDKGSVRRSDRARSTRAQDGLNVYQNL